MGVGLRFSLSLFFTQQERQIPLPLSLPLFPRILFLMPYSFKAKAANSFILDRTKTVNYYSYFLVFPLL